MRGGQHQVLLLLKGLREAGHESLLLAREQAPLWTAAAAAHFPIYPAATRELFKLSRKADLVHAHDARAHTIAAIASRRKFVVSRRVAFPVRRSVASVWKYQRATRYLAVSQFVARELEGAGIRREKIDVVYDGVDSVPNIIEWNPDHPAVAPATRDPEKGRDLLEQAAEIARVRVVFSENLQQDLQHASMFVYITRSEGLGSAVLLAMNIGVPVIASWVGGLAEVFADGVSGVFVRNDTDEVARAMRSILDQPALTRMMIREAKTRVNDCFTREHLVRGTLNSYGRALAT